MSMLGGLPDLTRVGIEILFFWLMIPGACRNRFDAYLRSVAVRQLM